MSFSLKMAESRELASQSTHVGQSVFETVPVPRPVYSPKWRKAVDSHHNRLSPIHLFSKQRQHLGWFTFQKMAEDGDHASQSE